MPLDEMRLMLEQWGNITGEPRGVDYTEVLGSWAGGPMLSRVKCVIFSSIGPDRVRHCRCVWFHFGK